MLYRYQQIHLIYRQTIQTNHPNKLIDFFLKFFSGWPGQVARNLSIKSIFAAIQIWGIRIPWGIPAFCHMEDPAIRQLENHLLGVPGPGGETSRSVMMGGVVTSE